MEIEGIVTDINEAMLTFTIDGKTRVHTVFLFINNPSQKLPQIGTKVTVNSQFYNSNGYYTKTIVLCFNTDIQGDCSIICSFPNKLQQIVKNLPLRPTDLLVVDDNYGKLKRLFQSPHNISCEEIIVCTIVALKQRTHFTLRFISELGYVEPPGPTNVYKSFSYWTFGTHWDKAETRPYTNYLIGFLYVKKKYGNVCFTDFKRTIPCIVMFTSSDHSLDFINKYVLIENYTILTEVYNNIHQFFSLEYLLVKSEYITVLPLSDLKFSQNLLVKKLPTNFSNDDCIDCQIISKSLPMINSKSSQEYWLEVATEEQNMFLCLNQSYTEAYPLIKPRFRYKIVCKGSALKKVFNKEITKVSSLPQYQLPNDAIFVPADPNLGHSQAMDLETAKQQLALGQTNPVSFEGTVIAKKFVDPISSRTDKLTTDPNFGTPGPKTHLLEFEGGLTLYLNNLENMILPYCIIPNMRITVHNVVVQNRRYYKCTAMTSFEVVAYAPSFPFETVNLKGWGLEDCDWGSPSFLGGSNIPIGVIIWSKVTEFFILGLKIKYYCTNCNQKDVTFGRNCPKCQDSSHEMTATITLITYDQLGQSKVIAKHKSGVLLLRLLLDLQEPVFEQWCEGFKILNNYEYSRGVLKTEEDAKTQVKNILTTHFDTVSQYDTNLELKCRKIDNEASGRSLFYLLDARRS